MVLLNSINKTIHGVFEGSYFSSISVIYFCFLVGSVPFVSIPLFIDDETIRIFGAYVNNAFSKAPLPHHHEYYFLIWIQNYTEITNTTHKKVNILAK